MGEKTSTTFKATGISKVFNISLSAVVFYKSRAGLKEYGNLTSSSEDMPISVTPICLIQISARRLHVSVKAVNRLPKSVILEWRKPSRTMIMEPIPRNNITIDGKSTKNVYLKLYSLVAPRIVTLHEVHLQARDKETGFGVLINGRETYPAKAYKYRTRRKLQIVISYPGIHNICFNSFVCIKIKKYRFSIFSSNSILNLSTKETGNFFCKFSKTDKFLSQSF